MDVFFELHSLEEGHLIHLKNLAWNIHLHFIFIFQETNHLIYVNLSYYSEIN